jgi:hypothetical protein
VVTEIFVSRDDGKPKLRQKLPTRTRQVVCASYHAWFLLGKTPTPSTVLLIYFNHLFKYSYFPRHREWRLQGRVLTPPQLPPPPLYSHFHTHLQDFNCH